MGWHVLHTYVAQEQRLARFLTERNILVFAPEIKITKPRTLIQALFPRYILACVNLQDGDQKALVRNARGLHSILEFCGKPAVVTVDEIMTIQSRIRDGYVRLDSEIEDDGLYPGVAVAIGGDGPFSGLKGVFSRRLTGKDRVRILLSATGLLAGAATEIDRADVVILPEERRR